MTRAAGEGGVGSAVDRSPLDDLDRDLGGDAAVEIVMAFLAELPSRLAELGDADQVQLRRAAHTLKSSAALVGARRLSDLALALERRAADRLSGAPDTDHPRDLEVRALDELTAESAAVAAELRAWVLAKVS